MNKKELLEDIEELIETLENMGETLYSNDEEIDTLSVVDILADCKEYIENTK